MKNICGKYYNNFLLMNWIIPTDSSEKTAHARRVQPAADTTTCTDQTCPLRPSRSDEFLLTLFFPKYNHNWRGFLRYTTFQEDYHANLEGHLLDLFRNSRCTISELNVSSFSCTTLSTFFYSGRHILVIYYIPLQHSKKLILIKFYLTLS